MPGGNRVREGLLRILVSELVDCFRAGEGCVYVCGWGYVEVIVVAAVFAFMT